MPADVLTSIRLSARDRERAERLISWVAADPLLAAAGHQVSRSTVLRIALARGLDVLEAEARAVEDTDR